MKTNKLVWTLLTISGLGLVSSCTDLATKEIDSRIVSTTAGGGSDADGPALLKASYQDLGVFTDQASVYSMMEHVTDELIPPTRGVDWSDNGVWRSLYQHNWDPAHTNVLNAWNSLNQNVYRTQLILDAANSSAQEKAEAKFLRAFNRWHVMDLWGQTPDRKTTDGAAVNPKVYTRKEAFDLVVADINDALAGLPNNPPSVPNHQASKAAANALLARLYLNKAVYMSATGVGPYTHDKADMDKVVQYCEAVKAAGYSLNSDYYANFKAAGPSNEIIFTSNNGSPQNRVYMTLHYAQNPSGWNGFATIADFYGKFQDGDIRKGIKTPIPGLPYGKTDASKYAGIGLGFLAGPQFKDDGNPVVDNRTGLNLNFTADVPLSGAATAKGIRVMKYHPAFHGG